MKSLTLKDFKYLIDNLFKNKKVLDKLSDSDGELHYDNKKISSGELGTVSNEMDILFDGLANTINIEYTLSEDITKYEYLIVDGGVNNGIQQRGHNFIFTDTISYKVHAHSISKYLASVTYFRLSYQFKDSRTLLINSIDISGWSNCAISKIYGFKKVESSIIFSEEEVIFENYTTMNAKTNYKLLSPINNYKYIIVYAGCDFGYYKKTSLIINPAILTGGPQEFVIGNFGAPDWYYNINFSFPDYDYIRADVINQSNWENVTIYKISGIR